MAATAAYLIVANMLMAASPISPQACSVIAYCFGIAVSYFGQSRFAFLADSDSLGQIVRFAVLSIAGVALSYLLVHWTTELLGFRPLWGTLATAAAMPVLSFVVMRHWVFSAAR
jgi:putative flippase GtrA